MKFQGNKIQGYRFQGYMYRVFKETQIRVRVSSWIGVKDGFSRGFTRRGVWFQPPTPPTLSLQGDSLDFETKLPSVVSLPLVWNDMYGASKGPC
jgi:hypothetical protein